MNKDNIFEQLKVDEGVVYEVYKDHLGYPTFGVGHLILESDEEFEKEVGTLVSEERVKACFEKDLDTSISECVALYGDDWDKFQGTVQEVLVNMMFNMGRPRLSKFKKFQAAIESEDFITASEEMEDSRWFKQVGPRAERLQARIYSLGIPNG